MRRLAPKPWEEAYRLQGRLWRGVRLDEGTSALLAARPTLRDARWVELGCGDGKGLVPLMRAGVRRVVGLDASRQGLRLARQAAQEAQVDAILVQGDVRAPPFRAATFTALRAVHVLGHLLEADRVGAAACAAALLGPGGTALFTEFTTDDFRAGSGEPLERGTYRRGHGILTHYFAVGELPSLLAAAGFRVVSTREERFMVRYEGRERPRSRVVVVATRDAAP